MPPPAGPRGPRPGAPPPQEYTGSNDKHKAANNAGPQKRRGCNSRYACRMGLAKCNLFHLNLECMQQGLTRTATPEQRADPAFRVKGAPMPCKRF